MLYYLNAIIKQQETLNAGNSDNNKESLENYIT
jgi:hypothetical protein